MYSFIIKNYIKDEDIRHWLLSFLDPLPVSVAVFSYEHKQQEELLFESYPMTGNYCMQLHIYTTLVFDEKKLATAICRFFKTKTIISDDSLNPYSWILINGDGEEKTVYQKVDTDDDVFIIKE